MHAKDKIFLMMSDVSEAKLIRFHNFHATVKNHSLAKTSSNLEFILTHWEGETNVSYFQ